MSTTTNNPPTIDPTSKQAPEPDLTPSDTRIRHLLASNPHHDNKPDITSSVDWLKKREHLHETILKYLGEPSQTQVPAPEYIVLDRTTKPAYEQLKIEYLVEPDEPVRAHLLIPHEHLRREGAAVLCQHGTSHEAKDTQIGVAIKPGRDFGKYLAEHGFITLSPDHICAGERLDPRYHRYDTTPFYQRHPDWSAVGKTIWDGQRALDILEQLDCVDANRLGTVGHSLGGYGSIFLGAFDSRVLATVSSCGLTTFQGNPKNIKFARDFWYVHFPHLRSIFLNDEPLPFDFHELAGLIAPRAFLNLSGLTDKTYGNNHTLPEVTWQLKDLYNLFHTPDRFACMLFGGGHDVPSFNRALLCAWFERWLVGD